ncbi:hypothetical protein D3C72_2326680 [compost metagenome]
MPLSCRPIICPWPIPQANRLNRTQKYKVQAISGRSEGVRFMAATLAPMPAGVKAESGLLFGEFQRRRVVLREAIAGQTRSYTFSRSGLARR